MFRWEPSRVFHLAYRLFVTKALLSSNDDSEQVLCQDLLSSASRGISMICVG